MMQRRVGRACVDNEAVPVVLDRPKNAILSTFARVAGGEQERQSNRRKQKQQTSPSILRR